MDGELIVIIVAVIVFLIAVLIRAGRRGKCRGCVHFAEQYITALRGEGLFRFGYCQRLVHDTPIVEPDIERECEWYEDAEKAKQRMPAEEKEQRTLSGR